LTVRGKNPPKSQARGWLAPVADEQPVTEVPIASLLIADSPRLSGENREHVQALAATDADLPPIIVHHPSMRVIDGIHRVSVARLQGQEKIAVKFFYGDEADAFVLAVKSNIAHGLPLSLADRKAAAQRIVKSHPQWSDRMIAAVSGLAAKTIAEIRVRTGDGWPQGSGRVGQDGRSRPIDWASGRLLASELITNNPGLSLRQVAREAGISPETARDVRNRLRNGEAPVPARCASGRLSRGYTNPRNEEGGPSSQFRSGRGQLGQNASQLRASNGITRESAAIMERLKSDPALRFTETGRSLLRLLHFHMIDTEEWRKISENVPPHCSGIVAHLAKECSQRWHEFAERLEQKVTETA
jgi:ParB-like chromosome segregation protein Spo0J